MTNVGTHALEKTDVLPERADTAKDADEEHDDADGKQEEGRVGGQVVERPQLGLLDTRPDADDDEAHAAHLQRARQEQVRSMWGSMSSSGGK